MSKKILLLVASEGHQPMEYNGTKEELKEAGFEVVTGSDKKETTTINVDVVINDLNLDDYDGLYIIGGPGALPHLDNENVHLLLNKWAKTGKPYGAICSSVRILAKAGVLNGKKAVGWNGDNRLPDILKLGDAEYVFGGVYTDGMATTGEDPFAAHDFGKAIVQQFKQSKSRLCRGSSMVLPSGQ